MKTRVITVIAAAAAATASLVVAGPGLAQPRTTNAPQMLVIKVTITDNSITMKPRTAERGSTALFIITNRGAKPHTLLLGDVERGVGKKIGFSTLLGPDEKKTIVMFLDYRGPLPYSGSHPADARKSGMKGIFKII